MRPVTLYRAGGMRFAVACSRRTLTESAPFLQARNGARRLVSDGVLFCGFLGRIEEGGQFLCGLQTDNQAASRHDVNLAV